MNTEPQRPEGAYNKDCPKWHAYAYQLAFKYSLSRRHMSGLLGVEVTNLKGHRLMCSFISKGLADHQAWVMGELISQASLDPDNFTDQMERGQIRNLKADAVKTLVKIEETREKMLQMREEGDSNREVMTNLSSDELKVLAARHLK